MLSAAARSSCALIRQTQRGTSSGYRDKIFASAELLYASDRLTLGRSRTGDLLLLNTTLFSRELVPGLDFSASIYNLLDQKFHSPGGSEHAQETLEQDGRTFRFKVNYRF